MKNTLAFLLTLIVCRSIAQPATSDEYVQNFYTSCKPAKYSAFQDLQVGFQLLDTKQYGRSIDRFARSLEKDSTCCDAFYMLAYCYQRQEQLSQAFEYCERALACDPQSASAWIVKGTTFLMSGDSVASEGCFRNAIKFAPTKLDGYYGLALSYYRQAKRKECLDVILESESAGAAAASPRDKKKMNKLKELIQEGR
ncbi:MAG TPA: tetratricopeptide repeat protein [Chryseosolibacter sp.]|nr:tetratricopeptide repeat protein [Chryseosolibacter sp.]